MVAQSQKRRLILFAALLLAALPLSAQQRSGQTDSLVRLLNARYLEQVETNGRMARKAVEPTFLHNGTYLSCDTALWHVEDKVINCFGHVQLLQGESVLTSEKLDYLIDDNLAQFRGAVVELRNQQDNILRTRVLDYNTQDSLAIFRGGAAMMSGEGQIIESDEGTYANARSLFTIGGSAPVVSGNDFVGVTANTDPASISADIYCLHGNELMKYVGTDFIPAGKAYLPVTVSGPIPAPKRISMRFNEPTAISNVTVESVKAEKFVENGEILIRRGNEVYNLQGQIVK